MRNRTFQTAPRTIKGGHMTREEFATMIRWPFIIWLVGIVNPFFMIPQLWIIWATESAGDISVTTLAILIGIQVGFSAHGFFRRDRPLMVSNGIAAAVTFITAISVLYLR